MQVETATNKIIPYIFRFGNLQMLHKNITLTRRMFVDLYVIVVK